MHNLICADVLEWTRNYTGPRFHAALFDPPYHLTSITKRFGKNGSAPAKHGKDGAFTRASRGFLGQTWDGGDIAFQAETWESISSVLFPGAFGMAFASSRGWHRMACAIEDGGFIIHPSIFLFGWVTAQGFPKATNISKQIKKLGLGEEYEFALSGHRYGAQAIKPAMEPIVVFQKPYSGKPIDNIVSTGAGTLNIDAARLAHHGIEHDAPRGGLLSGREDANAGAKRHENALGRWPANFVLVHHPGCRCVGVENKSKMGGDVTKSVVGTPKNNHIFGVYDKHLQWIAYGNPDGTETVEYWECHELCEVKHFNGDPRFYYQAGWANEIEERLLAESPALFEAKASQPEREMGLEEQGLATVDDGRPTPIDNPYQRGKKERRNIHPSIKPLALTRWLASLLLPAGIFAPRRVFVPFAGTGSEMIGSVQAGWDEVVGIEKQEEYVEIGNKRLAYWDQHTPAKEVVSDVPVQQVLF